MVGNGHHYEQASQLDVIDFLQKGAVVPTLRQIADLLLENKGRMVISSLVISNLFTHVP
jgi:hypothetical protein